MSPSLSIEQTLHSSRIVGRYAKFFERPEARLRFLNKTLSQETATRAKLDAALTNFEYVKKTRLYEQLLKLWLYQLVFRELYKQLPPGKRRVQLIDLRTRAPLSARVFFTCYQFRHPLYVLGTVALMAALFGVYTGFAWSARRVSSLLAQRGTNGKAVAADSTSNPVFAQVAASSLPDYQPERVWLVEEDEGYERFSNGARILREYETANHPRGYQVYAPDGAPSGETGRQPVGIVYHTSESDLMPFNADHSESIEAHTRGLLEYVRKNSSYNYVIDRFGQIYRVVRDEDAANHAGNSVWAGAQGLFVGLNESFLGVCFETKTAAGVEERLTEAQLVSGRLLTQVLRSRHQIEDANCVTHGLVSVNPTSMLICFHHDWARGFPFEAMGLSDKYAVPPASVTEFGFTYDAELLSKLGGALWPGVAAAEKTFNERAARENLRPDELRRRMREVYRQRMDTQRGLRLEAAQAAAAD
ncbi:MAG TPA: N-acetylmuramoyl-L-alanine amidase [Pyrinomonadaceae bacterium]